MIQDKLFHSSLEDLLNQAIRQKQGDDSNPETYRDRVMSAARRVLNETNQEEVTIDHKKGIVAFRLDNDRDKIRMFLDGQEVPEDQMAPVIAELDEIGKPRTVAEKTFVAVSESGFTQKMGTKALHAALHSTRDHMKETTKTANSLLGALLQIIGRAISPR